MTNFIYNTGQFNARQYIQHNITLKLLSTPSIRHYKAFCILTSSRACQASYLAKQKKKKMMTYTLYKIHSQREKVYLQRRLSFLRCLHTCRRQNNLILLLLLQQCLAIFRETIKKRNEWIDWSKVDMSALIMLYVYCALFLSCLGRLLTRSYLVAIALDLLYLITSSTT